MNALIDVVKSIDESQIEHFNFLCSLLASGLEEKGQVEELCQSTWMMYEQLNHVRCVPRARAARRSLGIFFCVL